MEIINKYRINKIKNFINLFKVHCEKWQIECTFKSFLYYEWNGYYSPAYELLLFAPKIYLANSKVFKKYWNDLDVDFKKDLMDIETFRVIEHDLFRNKNIHNFLKKVMLSDSKV